MKTPLTAEERRIIKLFSEVNPIFDELAKATWPELFENPYTSWHKTYKSNLDLQQLARTKRNLCVVIGSKVHSDFEKAVKDRPSPFPIDYEDEYDV